MLGSLKLKYKLMILCAVPLVLAMVFAVFLINDSTQKSNNAQEINSLMSLAIANSLLVHELQKERGLTAGFLGSKGDSDFKRKLDEQRKNTDEKAQAKLAANKEYSALIESVGLSSVKQNNLSLLEKINQIRQEVNQQSIPTSQALGFYTNFNASLLDVISTVAEYATDPRIKQQGLAYYNFVQGKERAGVERAVMTNVFTRDIFDIKTYSRFVTLVTQQTTYLNEFKNLANADLNAQFKQIENSAIFNKVEDYRAVANKQNVDGKFGIQAGDWFDAATMRINELKKMEGLIENVLHHMSNENEAAASQANWFYILLTLGLGAGCVILAYAVIKGINKQVFGVVETLNYCVQHNALNKPLPVLGNDEISIMSIAVNEMLETFKSTIENLTSSSELLASSSEQNSVTVNQTTQALLSQKEQTYQVASAIEEMTVTIQEVANNTNATATAAKEAEELSENSRGVVNDSIKQIETVSEQVSGVHKLISDLHQSSSEMTSVIDVIKSIADQTNLLALNAAIEAARAGEQGRGFAVVADEVRTLAQRTQDSTRQIEDIISGFTLSTNNAFSIIESSQQSANSSVEQANNVALVINDIQSSITTINQMTDQIATATEEQVVVAGEVGQNVSQISAAADESATAAEQIAKTSISQAELATELKTLSSTFQIA